MPIKSKKISKKAIKKPGKHPGGRPSKYNPAYCKQATKLCLLGATDKELADFFGIKEKTLNLWKKAYPEFLQALKDGKDLADSKVATRLFQRAMGFEHDSEEIKVVSDGMGLGSSVVRVPVRKIYPPDTVAAIFWLKNRQRGKWSDRIEQDITSKGESIAKPMSDKQFSELVKMLNGTDGSQGKRMEKATG
jgi:hypothetical protein